MIRLLYTIIFAQAAVILSLLFRSPARKLVIAGIDRLKRGRGPIVVKTIAGTVLIVLISALYSVVNIQRGQIDEGGMITKDQVMMAKQLLEASLMGFFLFLALLTDRLHYYIRELRLSRKITEGATTNGVHHGPEDFKAREQQVGTFKEIIQQLESELASKSKQMEAAESSIQALRKQSEGLLIEYDRLLAENQELSSQLQSLDQRLSLSPVKKNS